jgi:hypothetical protein
MNTVIKPISLSWTISRRILSSLITPMLKALVIMTSLIKAVFFFTHHRKVVTYVLLYDLRNSHKGVPFKDSFQVENGKYM